MAAPEAKALAADAKAKGNAAFSKGNPADALPHYERAIELDPQEHVFHSNVAACHLELVKQNWVEATKLEHGARALLAARRCVELNSSWVKGLVRCATAEFETVALRAVYEREKAEGRADGQLQPEIEEALLETISGASLDACEAICRAGLALEPANIPLRLRLQTCRDAGHETDQAADSKLVDSLIDSEAAAAAKQQGSAAFAAKKFGEAAEKYTEALAHKPHDHLLYSNRSACYAELSESKKALGDATRCLELNPGFVKGYSRKSAALFQLGRYAEAEAAAQRGLELDPSSTALQGLLASAQAETGESEEVQRLMHQFREDQRKQASLHKALSGLNLGPNVNINGLGGGLGGIAGSGLGGNMNEAQMRQMARAMAGAPTGGEQPKH